MDSTIAKNVHVKRSFFNSLVFKTSLFTTTVMVLSLIVISAVFILFEQRKIEEEIVKGGETFAHFSIRKIYDDYVQFYTHDGQDQFANFKTLVQSTLKNNPDVVNVSLIAINGRVLFDSEEFTIGKATQNRSITDKQTIYMIQGENTSSRTIYMKNGQRVTEIVVPLPESGGGHVFSMRYLVSNMSLITRMNEVYRQILFTIIPLLFLVSFIAVVYAIGFTKPILQLTNGAEKIGEGNLNVHIDNRSKDEVGILAEVFNKMVVNLKNKIIDLTNAKEEVSAGLVLQQKEKDRLSASINSFILGFIMIDTNNKVININPAAISILHIKSHIVSLEEITEVLEGSCDLKVLHKQCNNEKRTIDISSVSFGAQFLHIMLTPILSGDKEKTEHIGTAILIEDITEAKILERSRDEFFSIASHELRTPLTAIRGNSSIIKDFYSKKIDPEIGDMVNDIHEASIRLIGIVNDFLDVSRIEQKRIEFNMEALDIATLITETIKVYQVTGSRAKLYIHFDNPEDKLPLVYGDKNRLRQVIINLIGNGLKFTKEGGVTLSAKANGKIIEVSVTDTGRGILPAYQGLLFHKFQQAGASLLTRDTSKGTGLGLYISKLLIEGMNGKIWLAKSEVDKGTTFTFTLPIASKEHSGQPLIDKEKQLCERIAGCIGFVPKTNDES